MKRGMLTLGVDASVIESFVHACNRGEDYAFGWISAGESLAVPGPPAECATRKDSQLAAALLAVSLGAVGEWQLVTSATQMELACQQLIDGSPRGAMPKALIGLLERAVRIIPVEASHLRSAATSNCNNLSLAVLAECARLAGAVAVLAMPPVDVSLRELGVPAMTPCAFFGELSRRYGLQYAEIKRSEANPSLNFRTHCG